MPYGVTINLFLVNGTGHTKISVPVRKKSKINKTKVYIKKARKII